MSELLDPNDHTAGDPPRERVLVVGSGQVGGAIAAHLARSGCAVTTASRHPRRADHPLIEHRIVDVCDGASVRRLAAELGVVDHMVFTAAANHVVPVREADRAAFLDMVMTKVWGPIEVARALQFAPDGSICLVSGAAARWSLAGRGLQRTVCAAVDALVEGLAQDLHPLRVNGISPGIVEAADQRGERLGARWPTVDAGEVAMAVEMVLRNRGMTGAVVAVDAGWAQLRGKR